MQRSAAAGLLERLRPLLGERITDSTAARAQFSRSEAYREAFSPDLVARPQNAVEVQNIVRACREFQAPIVPFGAGTSLEGNAAAVRGGLCLDMSAMDAITEINAADMDVRVGPGIRRRALNSLLRDTGLFFPIDPGADASIGGMASTRGSGTMAVRYGTMRENVLALEAVLPDGRLIRTGRRARKSAAGYDLTRLLVGAEGTLGIITEVTLRLYPIPEAIAAAVCPFPSLAGAVDATIAIMQAAIPIARVELLDAVMMRGVNRYAGLSYPEKPTLFIEFHGTAAAVAEQAERVKGILADHGAPEMEWAREPEARSRLWGARDNTLYAGRGLKPGSEAIITDVCVPISALARCLDETSRDLEQSSLLAPLVGHVGDGNFHLLILVDPANVDEIAQARAFHKRLVERALSLDGTCTGEHGIGTGKRRYLQQELGEAVSVMRLIKGALDPQNIMNPGKIFLDSPEAEAA
jgi:D-lactate dehydrogenase (cytochrome)